MKWLHFVRNDLSPYENFFFATRFKNRLPGWPKIQFFFSPNKLPTSFSSERPHSVFSDCKDFWTKD